MDDNELQAMFAKHWEAFLREANAGTPEDESQGGVGPGGVPAMMLALASWTCE